MLPAFIIYRIIIINSEHSTEQHAPKRPQALQLISFLSSSVFCLYKQPICYMKREEWRWQWKKIGCTLDINNLLLNYSILSKLITNNELDNDEVFLQYLTSKI